MIHPVAEIVVEVIHEYKMLFVYAASEDARIWLEKELPKYGTITSILDGKDGCCGFTVIILPLFKPREVRDHLLAYNIITPELAACNLLTL